MAASKSGNKSRSAADKATKRCSRCERELPKKQFPKNSSLADGLALYCRGCKRAADRDHRNGGPPKRPSAEKPKSSTPEILADGVLPPKRRGPASTITKQLIADLVAVLERGHTRRAAARRCSISEDTFATWMKRGGEDRHGPARELHDAVLEAEGEGELRLLELVRTAAEIDVHQARWILERRYSLGAETWARKEHLDVSTSTQTMDVSVVRELVLKRLEGLPSVTAATAETASSPQDADA